MNYDTHAWPEITKDTPIEVLIDIHRTIWNEVIKNIKDERFESRMYKPVTPYSSNCAFCEYDDCFTDAECSHCPGRWSGGRRCVNESAEFYAYHQKYTDHMLNEGTKEELIEAAKAIRDIPIKEEFTNV